jgi:hypothetical protein
MKFAWRLGKKMLVGIFCYLRATVDLLLFILSFKVFPLAWHVSKQPYQVPIPVFIYLLTET